jgi:hypothetical protein
MTALQPNYLDRPALAPRQRPPAPPDYCPLPYADVVSPLLRPFTAGSRLQSLAKISRQARWLPITASTCPSLVEPEYPHISAQASRCFKRPDSRLKKRRSSPMPPDTDIDNGHPA